MDRRDYIKTTMAGSALIGLNVLAAKQKQPNLLFVFPDQLRREAMGFWKKDKFKHALRTQPDPVVTPTLDQLAEESVVFTQAISTCPVCSPYRAMFMSGTYPQTNGVHINCREDREDHLRHDLECFTDVLAKAGYETSYVGKTHWERNDPLFDEAGNYVGSTESPGGHRMNGYDTYIPEGKGRHGNKYWFQCVKDVHKDPRVYSNDPKRVDGKKDGEQYRPKIYSPLLEANVIVDYLKNTTGQRDTSKPFSLIWAPNPPHNPYSSEEDCDEVAYRKYYKGQDSKKLLIRPNVEESDDEIKERAHKSVPFYLANVTGVDKQLGRVLEALEESGEADNTIVVFTSDHGEMMGSHNKFGKLVIYEESFCVPLMIKVPGKTKSRLEDLMITPVDMMPTLLGMMGMEHLIPKTVEGQNFAKEVLEGDWSSTPKPKSALFLTQKSKGVRTERYTFYIDKAGKQMLFDNEQDPYQMKSIELTDIPKESADFLMSELGKWLVRASDSWVEERAHADLIQYPA